jgi:hypothetical protein
VVAISVVDLYRNNLKNRFLAASAWQHILGLHSRLAYRQWSLAPDSKSAPLPCQIPDSSSCFGIYNNAIFPYLTELSIMAAITSIASGSEQIKIENLPPGWQTAIITYQTKKGETKRSVQIIDARNNPPILYWHDSMRNISIKCALLVMAIPFFALINIGCNLARRALLVIGTFASSMCTLMNPRNWGVVEQICNHWFHATAEILLQGGSELIHLPLLAFKMQLCCLYGIFFPLEGRLLAGEAERALKGCAAPTDLIDAIRMRKKDLRCHPHTIEALVNLVTNKDSEFRFYWAFCFQPVGLAIIQDNVLKIDRVYPS